MEFVSSCPTTLREGSVEGMYVMFIADGSLEGPDGGIVNPSPSVIKELDGSLANNGESSINNRLEEE